MNETLTETEESVATVVPVTPPVLLPTTLFPASYRRAQAYATQQAAKAAAKELTAAFVPVFGVPKPPPLLSKQPKFIIRADDDALITRWCDTRSGIIPEQTTEAMLYTDAPGYRASRRRVAIWAKGTRDTARKSLRHFASRCPTPLLQVGLMLDADPASPHTARFDTRQEIIAYFNRIVTDRMPAMMAQFERFREGSDDVRMNMVTQTNTWVHFVRFGTDFYEWAMSVGLRPPNTNPFALIAHPKYAHGKKRVIVREWYQRILRSPRLDARERALVTMLAHGLRATEVIQLKLSDLSLKTRRLRVVGKGAKVREPALFEWGVQPMDQWLSVRRSIHSPWVFPGVKGDHLSYRSLRLTVRAVAERVLCRPEDAGRAKKITPHGFRHFFCSQSIKVGMPMSVAMKQVGHETDSVFQLYVTVDENLFEAKVAEVDSTIAWLGVSKPPAIATHP